MQNDRSSNGDERIEQLESLFPTASDAVFFNAYQRALAAGLSVMVSEQGKIFEVFPDGHRTFVKTIDPPLTVEPGQKFTIP